MIIPHFSWTFTKSNPSEFKLLVLIFRSSMQISTLLHASDCMELSPIISDFIQKVNLEPMPDGLNVCLVTLLICWADFLSYHLLMSPSNPLSGSVFWGLLKDRNQCWPKILFRCPLAHGSMWYKHPSQLSLLPVSSWLSLWVINS